MGHYTRRIHRAKLNDVVMVQREDGTMAQARYLVRKRRTREYAYIQWRDGSRVREKYIGVVVPQERNPKERSK